MNTELIAATYCLSAILSFYLYKLAENTFSLKVRKVVSGKFLEEGGRRPYPLIH